VLYHLWKQDGISQQELCTATFRDKPSITRLLDNLEKLDMVVRKASLSDKRSKLIMLTAAARELQEKTMRIAAQTLNEALEGVAPTDLESAKKVLQQVYDNLS
jgi:DNA-binding MarR family transcriptional regulator